jgi:hypothetical protein
MAKKKPAPNLVPTPPVEETPAPSSTALQVDHWNRTEPRALINLVPPGVAAHLMTASGSHSDYFGQAERDLYQRLKSDGFQPNATDNRLRLAFWNEYERAQTHQDKMNVDSIIDGVCSRSYFYGRYLTNAAKVAWLSTPPASYKVIAEEALAFGYEQLREILDLPIKNETTGRLDVKLMELKAKIVAMLDVRVKGAVVQKVEQKNMNLNVSTSDGQVAKMAIGQSMSDIEKRLKELERRERKALNLPEPKDIEAEVLNP